MSILSPESQILPNAAAFIGVAPALFGITALVRPRAMLGVFEFPVPKTADGLKLTDSLFRLFGVRDLALGLAVLAIRYRGDRELLGWALLFGSLVPIADGLVSNHQIGGGVWKHWTFVPVMLGLSASLLGWIG